MLKIRQLFNIVRGLNGSIVKLGPTLDLLFGQVFDDTVALSEVFYMEFATVRWECDPAASKDCPRSGRGRCMAVAQWAEMVFDEDLPAGFLRYGECAPMWAHIALLVSFKMSLKAAELWDSGPDAWRKRGRSARRQQTTDLALALTSSNAFFDTALSLSLLCPALPGAPVSWREMIENARNWAKTWRQSDPFRWEWWRFGHTPSAVCPPEVRLPKGLPGAAARAHSVVCLVPAVWPREHALLHEIATTYGAQCDFCGFFVSQKEGDPRRPPSTIAGCSVIDLREHYESISADEWSVPNILQKLAHMVEYAEQHTSGDWVCLVETDVYFSPVNFRGLVHRRGLHAHDVHWLGYTHMHSVLEEGMMVEPATGSCLSRRAVTAAGRELRVVRNLAGSANTLQIWPPAQHTCEPYVTGVHSDLTPIFNACMRLAGVFPPAPELIHDERGRMYFPNLAWNENLSSLQPPERPCYLIAGEVACTRSHRSFDEDFVIWKGREFMYSPCLGKNPDGWVALYPVMFHGHVTHSSDFNLSQRSAYKRLSPSLSQVHARLLESDYRFGAW